MGSWKHAADSFNACSVPMKPTAGGRIKTYLINKHLREFISNQKVREQVKPTVLFITWSAVQLGVGRVGIFRASVLRMFLEKSADSGEKHNTFCHKSDLINNPAFSHGCGFLHKQDGLMTRYTHAAIHPKPFTAYCAALLRLNVCVVLSKILLWL